MSEQILEPQFSIYIDSTMISAYRSCKRKFMLEFLYGIVPARPSIHLHAGAVYAKGLEVLRKTYFGQGPDRGNLHAAVMAGAEAIIAAWGDFETYDDTPKSLPNIINALGAYVERFPPHDDHILPHMSGAGEPMVEFNFGLPLPDTAHPITGEPILYVGRFDMLGEYNNTLFVVDDKTTSQLGAKWGNQWRLRSQFTGYVWGAREYGFPVGGAITRGCAFRKNGSADFAEAITYRPGWMIDEWLEGVVRDVNEICALWHSGHWQKDYNEACAAYGGCSFADLCERHEWKQWVFPDFTVARWDPTAKEPRRVEPTEFQL